MDKQHGKANATGEGGVGVAGGEAKATKHKQKRACTDHHIKNVISQIVAADLRLTSSAGDTQLATLPKVLEHLGITGLNTYEGVALGYLRLATRIKELKETYVIHSLREDVYGPDGLWHKNVARYVWGGKRKDLPPAQQSLLLEVGA
jgi:hypothetical protein